MLIVLGMLNLFSVNAPPTRVSPGRPLLIGVVHGLAGSGAALLLVPLIDDPRFAALYLLVFGVGPLWE